MHHAVALALLLVMATHGWATDQVRLARYTTVAAVPDTAAMDPLSVMATVHFPRGDVRTVGDAVAYLLMRTGYSLASADTEARALLELPLPESHRVLGPYPARAILEVLVGEPFQVTASPVQRTLAIALAVPDTVPSTVARVRREPVAAPVALEPLK